MVPLLPLLLVVWGSDPFKLNPAPPPKKKGKLNQPQKAPGAEGPISVPRSTAPRARRCRRSSSARADRPRLIPEAAAAAAKSEAASYAARMHFGEPGFRRQARGTGVRLGEGGGDQWWGGGGTGWSCCFFLKGGGRGRWDVREDSWSLWTASGEPPKRPGFSRFLLVSICVPSLLLKSLLPQMSKSPQISPNPLVDGITVFIPRNSIYVGVPFSVNPCCCWLV